MDFKAFIFLSPPFVTLLNPPHSQGHMKETKKLGIVVSLGTGKVYLIVTSCRDSWFKQKIFQQIKYSSKCFSVHLLFFTLPNPSWDFLMLCLTAFFTFQQTFYGGNCNNAWQRVFRLWQCILCLIKCTMQQPWAIMSCDEFCLSKVQQYEFLTCTMLLCFTHKATQETYTAHYEYLTWDHCLLAKSPSLFTCIVSVLLCISR